MSALDRFFDQTSMLPPAPRVVSDLIARFDDPRVDIRTISNMLSRDPVLVAKILRMANSSYYGVSGTIGSVDDAVKLLGLIQVQVIVITCGVAGGFSKVKGLSLAEFWKTSLLAGFIARALAMQTTQNPNLAFTAGLMHNIGQLLIHIGFPEAGVELEQSGEQGDFNRRRLAEKEVLGVDHCEIGAELARRWNFPATIAEAIRYYADPDAEGANPLARLIFVAATIAHALARDVDVNAAIAAIPPETTRILAIDPSSLLSQVENFRSLVAEVVNTL
jgi:putative nucleotidyltransferase with HDIG domain